jgi:ABC-type bacteriocin/lantibiotic exporter with double-glycine peptidase domain
MFAQDECEIINQRYANVLRVCSLVEDVKTLPDGDLTVVGEKGDTLSGGQKKRINLARSIYNEADIYFFDDSLAALDVKVAHQIMNNCMHGFLRDKTRLYFTNSLQLL